MVSATFTVTSPSASTRTSSTMPEVDDARVELGVDDAREHAAHVVGVRRRPGNGLVDWRAGIVGVGRLHLHGFTSRWD